MALIFPVSFVDSLHMSSDCLVAFPMSKHFLVALAHVAVLVPIYVFSDLVMDDEVPICIH